MDENTEKAYKELADILREKQGQDQARRESAKASREPLEEAKLKFKESKKLIKNHIKSVNDTFKDLAILEVEEEPYDVQHADRKYIKIFFKEGVKTVSTPSLMFELIAGKGEVNIIREIPLNKDANFKQTKPLNSIEDSHYYSYILNFVNNCINSR